MAHIKTINIVNDANSYTAAFIKQWCEYHQEEENNSEFQNEAYQVYDKYWGGYAECKYPPNPKVYYFVWYGTTRVLPEAHLERDIDKNPKRQ